MTPHVGGTGIGQVQINAPYRQQKVFGGDLFAILQVIRTTDLKILMRRRSPAIQNGSQFGTFGKDRHGSGQGFFQFFFIVGDIHDHHFTITRFGRHVRGYGRAGRYHHRSTLLRGGHATGLSSGLNQGATNQFTTGTIGQMIRGGNHDGRGLVDAHLGGMVSHTISGKDNQKGPIGIDLNLKGRRSTENQYGRAQKSDNDQGIGHKGLDNRLWGSFGHITMIHGIGIGIVIIIQP
mmetsp:Transcript_25573/g.53247  ORF Transcript_25573/g.53247 Transcript_25573/m.53247 type:complete len:235 (-) Transcript_25573:547-1251(-)